MIQYSIISNCRMKLKYMSWLHIQSYYTIQHLKSFFNQNKKITFLFYIWVNIAWSVTTQWLMMVYKIYVIVLVSNTSVIALWPELWDWLFIVIFPDAKTSHWDPLCSPIFWFFEHWRNEHITGQNIWECPHF